MGADCKSVGLRLPRFESWTCHQGQRLVLVSGTARNPVSVRSGSAAESKATATASRSSGKRWPYRSSVSPGRGQRIPDRVQRWRRRARVPSDPAHGTVNSVSLAHRRRDECPRRLHQVWSWLRIPFHRCAFREHRHFSCQLDAARIRFSAKRPDSSSTISMAMRRARTAARSAFTLMSRRGTVSSHRRR